MLAAYESEGSGKSDKEELKKAIHYEWSQPGMKMLLNDRCEAF